MGTLRFAHSTICLISCADTRENSRTCCRDLDLADCHGLFLTDYAVDLLEKERLAEPPLAEHRNVAARDSSTSERNDQLNMSRCGLPEAVIPCPKRVTTLLDSCCEMQGIRGFQPM